MAPIGPRSHEMAREMAGRAPHAPLGEPLRVAATLALSGRAGAHKAAGAWGAWGGAPARPPAILLLGCGDGTAPALLAACGADVTTLEPHGPAAEVAAALLRAADLPGRVIHAPFETAAAHGIGPLDLATMAEGWSDASGPARAAILALLAARLRAGATFYLHHSVMLGAARDLPLRRLARATWARSDPGLAPGVRADAALGALNDMLPACHALLRAYGGYEAEMAEIGALPAHARIARWFEGEGEGEGGRDGIAALGRAAIAAGLGDPCPADPMRLVRDLDLTAEQQALIDAPSAFPADPSQAAYLAAELADLATCRVMRVDLLVKSTPGPRDTACAGAIMLRRIMGEEEALATPLLGFLGPHGASRAVFGPILRAAPEGESVTLAALAAAAGLSVDAAIPHMAALIGQGSLAPATTEAEAARIAPACARLNAVLAARWARDGTGGPLAAPALGGAVFASAAALAAPGARSDSQTGAPDRETAREIGALHRLGVAWGA